MPGSGLLSGTSSEFLGLRPLPRILRRRPLVVILGPPGVGKTAVALRLAGEGDLLLLEGERLRLACVQAVRRQAWSHRLMGVRSLLLDGPTCLHRRPGATRLLHRLIAARAGRGLRTFACQGADDSVSLLLDALEPRLRATLCLRFPQGRARRRFAVRTAERMGLDPAVGRSIPLPDPWSYPAVLTALQEAASRDAGG